MDDLIRKQTVLNMIDDVQFGNITKKLSQLYEAVRNYPSVDAVEVVRCRDCKHLHEDDGCPLRYFRTHLEDDFCSYGERRTDETD